MNLDEYSALFLVLTVGLVFVAASPALIMTLSSQDDPETFSEFWLLGPEHIAGNFPSDVSAGETYTIFVDLVNHMSHPEYYLVIAKFRNVTQTFQDLSGSQPSSSPSLYEFRFSLTDETSWESTVDFGFNDVSIDGDVLTVGDVVINGIVFPVEASTSWNSENNGFYFQLFFELWRYDVALKSFMFDNQFVGIWLNMTSSQ